jgi:hypothetical protein
MEETLQSVAAQMISDIQKEERPAVRSRDPQAVGSSISCGQIVPS